jgi:hypothetical protein
MEAAVQTTLRRNVKRITTMLAVLACAWTTAGCVPVAVTAAGIGMATGVSHALGGMVYKTFTTPQANVKKATLGALNRMQIQVVESKRNGSTDVIKAKAVDREIEIELESLTPTTPRLLVVAKKSDGILRDSATATEIILQTEKFVGTT